MVPKFLFHREKTCAIKISIIPSPDYYLFIIYVMFLLKHFLKKRDVNTFRMCYLKKQDVSLYQFSRCQKAEKTPNPYFKNKKLFQ